MPGRKLTSDDRTYLLDGQPHQIISGSICYFRIMPDQWADRLAKLVALGANAVEVYIPWNFHETRPGEWDFSGRKDVARFISLAGDKGLHVLLRPGPFICAEWTMGGLPWWLLAEEPPIRLRCSDDAFMGPVEEYLRRLSKEVSHLLGSKGGPILAVQIENEYGYWGTDSHYLEKLKSLVHDIFCSQLFLFTVDGCYTPETQQLGGLDGVLRTASFGSRADSRFSALRKAQPAGPLTVMEFWVGWFSTWGGGAKAERSAHDVGKELANILAQGASVNIFVFAGGTSFGFTNGANLDAASGRLLPHITSYDYDGLLTEGGELTPKFHICREVIAAHTGRADLQRRLSSVQPTCLGPRNVQLRQRCSLDDALAVWNSSKYHVTPLPIEMLGEGDGYVYYRFVGTGNGASNAALTDLGGLPLKLYGVRDFAVVLCDGRPLGVWDRSHEPDLLLPCGTSKLEILVEITARVNFGPCVAERKGLVGSVRLGIRAQDEREVFGWESRALPMKSEDLSQLPWNPIQAEPLIGPHFWRGTFLLSTDESPADTWLRVPGFTRGFVALNGFNLGWHRKEGPQLSLYAPASLLRPGENEIVVFEFLRSPATPVPEVLLEERPSWSSNRAVALKAQITEIFDFTRQVGARRLLRLARDEVGTKKLVAGVTAIVVGVGAAVASQMK